MNPHAIEFAAIRRLVETALTELAADKDSPAQKEPINWADLHCTRVQFVEEEEEGMFHFHVYIEEAGGNTPYLERFVSNYLSTHGFTGVWVHTEW